jgi:hypothetical protein
MTYIEGIVNQIFRNGRIHVQAGHCIVYVVVHIGLQGVYVKPQKTMKKRTDKIYLGLMGHVPMDFLILRQWHVKACCRSINVIVSQSMYQGFDRPKGALVQNQISRKDMDCKWGMSLSKRIDRRNTDDF